MKLNILNFKNLTAVLLVLTVFSCQLEDNLQPEGQWELSAPVITGPSTGSSITLNQNTPTETVTFSWEAAISSAGFGVSYELLIDELGGDFTSPLFISESANNGSGTSLTVTYSQLNEALAFGGFAANSLANVSFAVRANSLSKTSQSVDQIEVSTFENEIFPERLFLSGSATENGDDLSQAIEMHRLNDDNGVATNVYEVYTSLSAGGTYKFFSEQSLPALQYGGDNGNVEFFGNAITVANPGQYRIQIDLSNKTYELLQIDFWSMVGAPINGGWGGDEPLEYQGEGVWQGTIDLLATGGFVFRANGDWSYLLKRVVGSQNTLVMESDAANQGVTVEDVPNNDLGRFVVTLDLSANGYTYSFEEDDTVIVPLMTPAQLFLFENGSMIEEFTVSGDVFSSDRFIPLQASNNYSLNSAMDGSGTSYAVNGVIADSSTPDADLVSDVLTLVDSSNSFTVLSDRAIRFSIDFSAPNLTWTYYNFKLFHWQVWDTRQEIAMTYSHPNTYTVTASLIAGSDSKFISPWDFDLGSDAPSSLSGNLINGGGSNLVNITTDGSYDVSIVLSDDYQTGTYVFN